jgi:hypothetical protein
MSYSRCKVPQAPPDRRARSISSNGDPASIVRVSNLLQQPRHQLIQPSFRLDENILGLDLLYVLPAKLDSLKFTRKSRFRLCIVKLGRLVFSSPLAIRALYGKFSRHAHPALHRNFTRARRTTHAAHAGVDDFPIHCHGGLLSCLRGLSGSPLHYFYEASQFLVDLAKPAGATGVCCPAALDAKPASI